MSLITLDDQTIIQPRQLMQLATTREGQPWVVTVHFVLDKTGDFYWLSEPNRRHSQELIDSSRVALTVVVEPDWPVVGFYAEAQASIVKDTNEVKRIMDAYVEKYNLGHQFYDRVMEGKNKHLLYKAKPTKISIFDERGVFGER